MSTPGQRGRAAARALVGPWVLLIVTACAGPDAPTQGSLQVQDDRGRTVSLAEPPQRIISIVPSITETLVELVGPDRMVARTSYDRDPRLAHLPDLGGGLNPNLEAMAGLEPDLLVAWAGDRDTDMGPLATSLGIGIYYADIGTLDGFFDTLERLGILLDREDEAQRLGAGIQARLDSISDAASGQPKPTVMYVVWHDPPQTAGPGSYIDALITLAGGETAFADADGPWPQVSLEEVVRRDPDVVISAGSTDEPNAAPDWLVGPGWRELTATATDRVHVVDADLFNRPGPYVADAADTLASLIHPRR